ncbi:TPA: hypothetical protein JD344_11530 [Serratia marcescens]|nr:hypothetical protein HMPREF3138_09360 [Serratia sp. HMSC15F11]HAU5719209.1 hypothetical protein [Serratia marcescens]HAU5740561.1 hypothetical protein [Serratia marcescens]HAU5745435.1 hypothetical protein [Serratia marcescens]HAU5756867.1 hypothetical protein [Serratia marcescens]
MNLFQEYWQYWKLDKNLLMPVQIPKQPQIEILYRRPCDLMKKEKAFHVSTQQRMLDILLVIVV